MRRAVSIVCLIVAICAPGTTSALDPRRFGDKCDNEVGMFEHLDYRAMARFHRRALNQIGILRISSSSDPWHLFEEFASRFSIVATGGNPEAGVERDVRSIVRTGGGDRHELAFVLLNLFAANDFATELVYTYRDYRDVGTSTGTIDRVFVYLPMIDQIFDPALPLAEQHKGPGQALLDGRPRFHRAYPVWRSAHNCPGSPFRGYWKIQAP
jgi:hypothetical protein